MNDDDIDKKRDKYEAFDALKRSPGYNELIEACKNWEARVYSEFVEGEHKDPIELRILQERSKCWRNVLNLIDMEIQSYEHWIEDMQKRKIKFEQEMIGANYGG